MNELDVLFVDDDRLVALANFESLCDLGHNVIVAHSSAGAMRMLDQYRPPLALVTDIDLGQGADGFHLARYARAAHGAIAVVYISGLCAERHANQGVARSVFLPKPFAPADLIRALAAARALVEPLGRRAA